MSQLIHNILFTMNVSSCFVHQGSGGQRSLPAHHYALFVKRLAPRIPNSSCERARGPHIVRIDTNKHISAVIRTAWLEKKIKYSSVPLLCAARGYGEGSLAPAFVPDRKPTCTKSWEEVEKRWGGGGGWRRVGGGGRWAKEKSKYVEFRHWLRDTWVRL